MRFTLLLLCFLLSGTAGLVYETLWAQQFSLVFGASELAVVTVLAAYMVGLTLGASLAGGFSRRVTRPLRAYALLELGVALSALAVPRAVQWAGQLQVAIFGGPNPSAQPSALASTAFHLVTSALILLVPTALMGATLPFLARQVVDAEERLGPRVAVLYAANTVGAAAGSLLSAFGLLPMLGLGRSLLVAVASSGLVSGLAALLARATPPVEAQPKVEPPAAERAILALTFLSGAVAFTLEVLWTRLVGHLLGGSLYAFGTMLAAFLTGIALGSGIAALFASTPEAARRGFVAAQILVAAFSAAAFLGLDPLAARLAGGVAPADTWAGATLCLATLVPTALGFGATFPFAVRLTAAGASDAGPASARVYAWSTVGSATGAVVGGLWLLPSLRFAGVAAAASATSLAIAGLAALGRRPRLWRWAAVAGGGLVAIPWIASRTPWHVLRRSVLTGVASTDPAEDPLGGPVVYYGVGRSATVLLSEQDGGWRLTTNGLPESVIQAPGTRPGRFAPARWLGLLPLVARPSARSMLVVGLGGGTTIEGLPATLRQVEVVELEPEVVAANRSVAGLRRLDPLADPRVHLRIDDARSALQLSAGRFDAIVSQPSHPWTSGSAHLFTREFYELVRAGLEPKGVFVQWMGLQFVDEALLRTLVGTLAATFAHVELHLPPATGAILLMASDAPLEVEAGAGRALAMAPQAFAELGALAREDVLAGRVLDDEGCRRVAEGAPLNTDAWNRLQTGSPRALRRHVTFPEADRIFARHDVLRRPPTDADRLYLLRRLVDQGASSRALRLAVALADPEERRTAFALIDLASGHAARGQSTLASLLARGPRGKRGLLAELEGGAVSREASFALLLAVRRAALGPQAPRALREWATADPAARALLAGWERVAAGEPAAVRDLEDPLAALEPRHPAFRAATRLRIAWRQASDDPGGAREALELLEPLLGPRAPISDLLLRARLAAQAGDPAAVRASLEEGVAEVEASRAEAAAAEALRLLEALPRGLRGAWGTPLRERLEAVAGSGRARRPAVP